MDTVTSIWNQIVTQIQLHPQLAWFLAVGLIAGWIAGLVLGGGGLLRNLIVGVIGSFVGGYVLQLTGYQFPGGLPEWLQPLLAATAGAILVVIIARIIAR